MKDTELRGVLLKSAYDNRSTQYFLWRREHFPGLEAEWDCGHIWVIAEQLDEHGLIDFKPSKVAGGFVVAAMVKITASGVDVVEEVAQPDIAISMNTQNFNFTNSTVGLAGNNNTQTFQIQIESLVAGIDNSCATLEEKEEAKSLLEKVLSNPTIASVAGGLAGAAANLIK